MSVSSSRTGRMYSSFSRNARAWADFSSWLVHALATYSADRNITQKRAFFEYTSSRCW